MSKILFSSVIAAAATILGPEFEYEEDGPRNLALELQFLYGSGGTNVTAYVQASFDGGATYGDIASFQVTTSALTKRLNLSSLTPVTTLSTPADGSLTPNTAVDGLIGSRIRVKVVSTGTYAGATSMKVFAATARMRKVAT
jgi:hypothetical protein